MSQQPYVSPQFLGTGGETHRPGSITLAVGLMRLQALLVLLAVPSVWLLRDELTAGFEEGMLRSGQPVDPRVLDNLYYVVIGVVVVTALVVMGLWLWMASANGKGRSYARILATVFFVLALLGFVANLGQEAPAWSRTASLVTIALDVVIVVAVWLPASSRYYREAATRRGYR